MAQALAPAYLRIAGPSSNNLTYQTDRIGIGSQVVSASSWRDLNLFLNHSGINVIVCLNVLQRLHNVWDSSNAVEIINTIDKMGIPVDYQLGYVLPATNLVRPPSPHQDVLIRAILFSTHPTASRCAYQEPSCSRLFLPHQDVLSRAILFSTHPTASRCAIKSHLVLDSSYRIKMCHQESSCSRLILPHQDVLIRAILFSTHPTASRCAYKSHLVLDSSYRIKMRL
ncbi:hypothetical protein WDU94_002297 [Cyamophila willieti]